MPAPGEWVSYKQPEAVTAARPARLSPAGSTGKGVQKALEAVNPATGSLLSHGWVAEPRCFKARAKGPHSLSFLSHTV